MTEFDAVADALLAAHNTHRPAGVPELKEWTGLGAHPDSLPIASLLWGKEKVVRVGGQDGPLASRTVQVLIEYLTRAVDGPPKLAAQRAAEPMRAWAVKALAGNLLGGLATDLVEIGTDRKPEQGEIPVARTLIEFALTYTSAYNDLERLV